MAAVYKCERCGVENNYKYGRPKYCRACRKIIDREHWKLYWRRKKEKAAVAVVVENIVKRRQPGLKKWKVDAKCPVCHAIHKVIQTMQPRPGEAMPRVYCKEHAARRHYYEVF
jgi:DNA-directed RNA polymerase subunit M/transcription elongation factor TFIIS